MPQFVKVHVCRYSELGDNCIQNSFGEVYFQIYGRKFSFTATRKRSHKRDSRTYIRRFTSQNEILNMVIPILMHF